MGRFDKTYLIAYGAFVVLFVVMAFTVTPWMTVPVVFFAVVGVRRSMQQSAPSGRHHRDHAGYQCQHGDGSTTQDAPKAQ